MPAIIMPVAGQTIIRAIDGRPIIVVGENALAAEAAAIAAEASATAAAGSATTANSHRSAAATSATNAATSATNAATSATNAANSATTANTHRGAAATSATNAANSATAADGSKTAAATSATNAAASATAADGSKTAAATSATNAAASATAADGSKTAAATSATNAANSATTANTHRGAAATSATNAAASATEANNQRVAAQAARDASVVAKDASVAAQAAAEAARDEAQDIAGGNVPWGNVTGKPTEYPPSAHNHTFAQVSGTKAQLNAAVTDGDPLYVGDIKFGAAGAAGVEDFNDPTNAVAGFGPKLLSRTISANAPPIGSYYHVQNIHYGTSGNITQFAIPYSNVDSLAGSIHFRGRSSSNVWTDWYKIFSTAAPPAVGDVTGLSAAMANKADLVSGKIPMAQLPAIAIVDTNVVSTQAQMLALTAQVGDIAVRTDINKTFVLKTEPATILANWVEMLTPTDLVLSVAGKTGAVVLVKGDVGLGSVDNTSDANKPVSTAQQAAINLKMNKAGDTFSGNFDTAAEVLSGATIAPTGTSSTLYSYSNAAAFTLSAASIVAGNYEFEIMVTNAASGAGAMTATGFNFGKAADLKLTANAVHHIHVKVRGSRKSFWVVEG